MHSVIDTHAHIYDRRFDDDRSAAIERARRAGVCAIVVPATKPSEFERVIRLSEEHSGMVYGAVGVHPHHAAEVAIGDLEEVERLAATGGAIAIGEIGLDYYYDYAPRERQREVFRRQLRIARRLGLPAVVHNRESDDDVLRIITEEQDGTLRFQLHCFSSSADILRQALELGGMISFTGNVTFRKATLDDVIRMVPDDRVMVETDSPYMTPVPHRGKRNEPCYVPLVAEKVAAVRRVDTDEFNTMTTANARRFFGLPLLLLLLLLPASIKQAAAQPQPVRQVDTTPPPPFERIVGIGGHFASSTYISGSTTEADGIPGLGAWLTIAPLQPWKINWLQIDLIYTAVESPGTADSLYTAITNFRGDTGLAAPSNQHNTFDIGLRFTANPTSVVTFYGAIGATRFHNEFGVDKYYLDIGETFVSDYTENAWGWNFGVGVTLNLETEYGTVAPTGEWRVMRITSERPLAHRTSEFFVSQPRVGLLLYPNFSRIFR